MTDANAPRGLRSARPDARLRRLARAALVSVGIALLCGASATAGRPDTRLVREHCPATLRASSGGSCAFWLLPSFPSGDGTDRVLDTASVPGLDVLPVWRTTEGAGVVVAVVDTGVDPSQHDYAANLLPGRNVIANDADTSDTSGHGTLVASLIAAAPGNGGATGIAPRARLLPVKIMSGEDGAPGSAADAVHGILWAVAHGARVVNCSFGTSHGPIPGMHAALVTAGRAGVLVVIAAGNDATNLDRGGHEYPDGYGLPNTLTVASMDVTGALAEDSNYGRHHVQIASIGDTLFGDEAGVPYGGFLGGTSAAAATVSGVAALLFAAYPDATPGQVRRAIIVGANRSIPALRHSVEAAGLVSATGALAAMAHPDTTAPGAFRLLGGGRRLSLHRGARVVLRWATAADPELEGYRVTVDGRTTIVPAGTTVLALPLSAGNHAWNVTAFDLSGNSTPARS